MARITEKNPSYRTKEEICRDVAFVLNCKELHYGTRRAVVDHAVWVWSEFEGKYDGCKYWSEAARAFLRSDGKTNLIHEHLVPRGLIRKTLFDLKPATPEAVRHVMETWCIGVVVTAEEDQRLNALKLRSKMPPDWDQKDSWARYTMAGITIAKADVGPSSSA